MNFSSIVKLMFRNGTADVNVDVNANVDIDILVNDLFCKLQTCAVYSRVDSSNEDNNVHLGRWERILQDKDAVSVW